MNMESKTHITETEVVEPTTTGVKSIDGSPEEANPGAWDGQPDDKLLRFIEDISLGVYEAEEGIGDIGIPRGDEGIEADLVAARQELDEAIEEARRRGLPVEF